MKYVRMPIEIESPEEQGYDTIRFNLSESSIRDRNLSELGLDTNGLVLAYGAHKGAPGLRTLIARQSDVPEEAVLTTAGAAGALFIIATTLLEKGDHLVVVRPNYATNIETPRAIGQADPGEERGVADSLGDEPGLFGRLGGGLDEAGQAWLHFAPRCGLALNAADCGVAQQHIVRGLGHLQRLRRPAAG